MIYSIMKHFYILVLRGHFLVVSIGLYVRGQLGACMCANRHDTTGLYVCYQLEVYICGSGCGIMGMWMSTGCTN